MKDPRDTDTPDLFPAPAPRGRPPLGGKAMTPAERQKRYRENLKTHPKPQGEPLNPTERAELEQLRGLVADYEKIVTRYEKQLDERDAEARALNEAITRHMKTEAQLRRIIEEQAGTIRLLEAKRRRRKT